MRFLKTELSGKCLDDRQLRRRRENILTNKGEIFKRQPKFERQVICDNCFV